MTQAGGPGLPPPGRLDLRYREGGEEEERRAFDAGHDIQPLHAIEGGGGDEFAVRIGDRLAEHRRGAEVGADRRLPIGAALDQDPVAPQQAERATLAELHAVEEAAQRFEVEGGVHDAVEAPRLARHLAAECDQPFLGIEPAPGAADEGAAARVVAVVSEAFRRRVIGLVEFGVAGIEHGVAVLIDQHDGAEVPGRGGAVEQDQVAQAGSSAATPGTWPLSITAWRERSRPSIVWASSEATARLVLRASWAARSQFPPGRPAASPRSGRRGRAPRRRSRRPGRTARSVRCGLSWFQAPQTQRDRNKSRKCDCIAISSRSKAAANVRPRYSSHQISPGAGMALSNAWLRQYCPVAEKGRSTGRRWSECRLPGDPDLAAGMRQASPPGSSSVKTVAAASEVTPSVPPCARAISAAMSRPRPRPACVPHPAVEGLEQPRHHLGRDRRAGIGEREQQAAAGAARHHAHRLVRRAMHQRVRHQVGEQLRDPLRVAAHRRREGEVRLDRPAGMRAAQLLDHLAQRLFQRRVLPLDRDAAAEPAAGEVEDVSTSAAMRRQLCRIWPRMRAVRASRGRHGQGGGPASRPRR